MIQWKWAEVEGVNVASVLSLVNDSLIVENKEPTAALVNILYYMVCLAKSRRASNGPRTLPQRVSKIILDDLEILNTLPWRRL